MGAKPSSISNSLLLVGSPRFGPFWSHQIPAYMLWKLDPYNEDGDASQISWTHMQNYTFPFFSLIGRVLKKVAIDQAILILITPIRQAQLWYPQLCQMPQLFLPNMRNLLIGLNQENHVLVKKGSLQLLA